ncbi:MAG: acyl-CoA dehydrogenase [Deltaproteobacteria bacterium]|nr:acyl-CoA dehydrogenase [Deltaproteobacteria bacterium]
MAQTPYPALGLNTVQNGWGGMLTLMPAMEIIARYSPSLLLAMEMSNRVFGRTLAAWGTENQKAQYLEPLLKGELLGAVALSEQAMNVENDPLATLGVIQGEQVVINGSKNYVVNAPAADSIAVAGRLDNEDVLFLVPKGAVGLVIGERLSTLGFEGAIISGLELVDCRISAHQVIKAEFGVDLLGALRLWENQVLIGAALGMMKGSFESARDYAKTHKSGGKPVIAYQEVGFKLAEMLTLFQTAELLAFRAAWYADDLKKDVVPMTLSAKVFCTENAEQVASWALQILAGAGYSGGNAAERAYRCAKYGQIAGVSTEIARVKIGDTTLGVRR